VSEVILPDLSIGLPGEAAEAKRRSVAPSPQ
jgi:hypothetical protein